MVLQVENIAKTIGRKKILSSVSFSMKAGQLYGIVGENGSGKSTLLKIIVGEWRSSNGNVIVNGRLGYCPQKCELIPQLTIDEHFRYFASAFVLSNKERSERSNQLLNYFNYEKYRNEKVINLSGGTQQKLNLSIALMSNPGILILDEPYNGFDWDTYTRFWSYTDQLRENRCAVLIVTHLLTEQKKFDHVFQLDKGFLI